MSLIPVLPVEYVYGVRSAFMWAAEDSGAVAFCLLLLTVAAAFSLFGVLAVFLSRLDG